MPFNFFGKLLFPREQASERILKVKVIADTVLLGGALGVVFYLQNSHFK